MGMGPYLGDRMATVNKRVFCKVALDIMDRTALENTAARRRVVEILEYILDVVVDMVCSQSNKVPQVRNNSNRNCPDICYN